MNRNIRREWDSARKKLGRDGENAAAELLISKGCRIITRNYIKKGGEVDIIAEEGEYIVFAEVKTRSSPHPITAAEAVTKKKQKRIIFAAKMFLTETGKKYDALQPRFDIIEVYTKHAEAGGKFYIRHLKAAFIDD